MGFLRFVDLIWVAPMVQGTEPYATIAYLRNEFWTCLRIQPEKKKQEDISMIKNRVNSVIYVQSYFVLTWLSV